jgi:NAD(P)-dependent dehydrogenase (short-subunit alcohol dehydrogenase family)
VTRHDGRSAVITGGTTGIGLAIARHLVDGGARVLVTGRNPARVDAARRALGDRAQVVRSDVASRADIDALGALVAERGPVDAVFVNHGVASLELLAQITEASYDETFAINTRGALFTMQRLVPHICDGGAIVVTTSVAVATGSAGMAVYSASKSALASLARVLAAELLPRRIRVNTVSPGFIDTPTMGVAGISDAERAAFSKLGDEVTPMKRHGTVDEVARAALFLAFDATFTTGVDLAVDGGLAQNLTPP